MKYAFVLLSLFSTIASSSEVPEALKPSAQETSDASTFLKGLEGVSNQKIHPSHTVDELLDFEPPQHSFDQAETFIETSKVHSEGFSRGLEKFLSQVPATPSQKTLKDVQAFLEKGQSCPKKCTSSTLSNKSLDSGSSTMDVFVSLSLGEAILKRLHQDVVKVGGRLVMRGLVEDSFKKTQEVLRNLEISVDIDPPAFEENKIKIVPTFILKDGNKVDQISGVRTLESVLELFAFQGESTNAKALLKSLQAEGKKS